MINEYLTVESLMATAERHASWAGSWVMCVRWFKSQMMQDLSVDPLTMMLQDVEAAKQVTGCVCPYRGQGTKQAKTTIKGDTNLVASHYIPFTLRRQIVYSTRREKYSSESREHREGAPSFPLMQGQVTRYAGLQSMASTQLLSFEGKWATHFQMRELPATYPVLGLTTSSK